MIREEERAEYLAGRGLVYDPRLGHLARNDHELVKFHQELNRVSSPPCDAVSVTIEAPESETPAIVEVPPIEIPEQLRRRDLRFIRVPPGKKAAMDPRWESDANFSHRNATMALHLMRDGGNFGTFPASGSPVIIIDADNLARLDAIGALDGFPETFTVESGSSSPELPKRHFYFEIERPPLVGKVAFFDPETTAHEKKDHLGEVFAQSPGTAAGYCVGPGSIHPDTHRPYTVLSDVPIAVLPRETWNRFVSRVRWKKQARQIERTATRTAPRGGSFGDLIGIRIDDVWPAPRDAEESGEWVKFAHPVHGSETGNNLAVNYREGVWHCHRCGSSGDALTALAVDERIIDCAEAGPDCLKDATRMEKVKEAADARGFNVDEAERQQRAARTVNPPETATPRGDEASEPDARRPFIQANDRQLPEITAAAVDALSEWNDPPRMFIRAGELVRIDVDEHGRPVIRSMLENRVRWALGQAVDFVTIETRRKGPIITPTIPPMPVARNILASADLCTWFPPLIGIIESPGIHPDGTLILEPGYDVASGLYYAPSNGLAMPAIPDTPTPEDVAAATSLIRECVIDFPFVTEKNGTEASRANAIAALMTPIIRPMIRGRVPLSLFDKPQMGSGASLLADMIVTIATGSSAAMTQAPTVREEWGKLLLSELSTGRAVIVFDNVTGVLSSPELASAITSNVYNGRVLGTTTTKHIENQPCWIATGINLALGGDMARRCVWIRMDPDDPRPWLRDKTKFTHPQLIEWAFKERGWIIAAVLTVARAWIRAGRKVPEKTPRLAVFDDWCETLGGMLSFMGIDGFLGNLDRQYEEADVEGPQWGAFLAKWYERFKDKAATVAEVIDELEKNASAIYVDQTMRGCAPDEVLEAVAVKGKANHQKLGQLLRYRKDTRFATGFKLVSAGTKQRAVQWRVIDVAPTTETKPGQQEIAEEET
jgi:hypothetical protein